MTEFARRPATPTLDRLTRREREYLRNRALGYSIEETAARMGISFNTAKAHLAAISGKLNTSVLVDHLRIVGWLRVPSSDELGV